MNFHINVAKYGVHRFNAHCRGADEQEARDIFSDMAARYPSSEGFNLSLMRRVETGTILSTVPEEKE